jgi:hypothetical protein
MAVTPFLVSLFRDCGGCAAKKDFGTGTSRVKSEFHVQAAGIGGIVTLDVRVPKFFARPLEGKNRFS